MRSKLCREKCLYKACLFWEPELLAICKGYCQGDVVFGNLYSETNTVVFGNLYSETNAVVFGNLYSTTNTVVFRN